MFRIGLTGGIGSGKSTVAGLLAAHGAAIIDADALARQLTQAGGQAMPAVAAAFGDQAVQPDGAMDRAYMRQRVFSDPGARRQLERILHPLIGEAMADAERRASGCYLVYDIPLLVESMEKYRGRLDRICVVDCEETEQIARVQARSGLTADAIADIIKAQASRQQRLAVADDVIFNGAGITLDRLKTRVQSVHQGWLAMIAQRQRDTDGNAVAPGDDTPEIPT